MLHLLTRGFATVTFPPLNSLRVFDCVARLDSFTAAAAELGVTQSAVSRQVAVLEGYLGRTMFRREPGGVALTAAGFEYSREIGPALRRIATATQALRPATGTATGTIRLRLYATFAVKWLLGRLQKFHDRYPGIELEISTTAAPVDFARDPVDMAVQFGDGTWPGQRCALLLPDIIQPVCSPKLLPPLLPSGEADVGMLRDHRLLHSHYRRTDWRDWLAHAGRSDLLREGSVFPSSVLTLQAAAEGLGIAIGQTALLADDLREGRLVTPFGRPLERNLGHYLVWPASTRPDRRQQALLAWFKEEAGRV